MFYSLSFTIATLPRNDQIMAFNWQIECFIAFVIDMKKIF